MRDLGRRVGKVAAVVLVAGIAASLAGTISRVLAGDRVRPTSSPSTSASAEESLPIEESTPTPDPARAVFADHFSGFELRPPAGWVEHFDYGIYSTAPRAEELWAYPDYEASTSSTFTITVRAFQEEKFTDMRKSVSENDVGGYRESGDASVTEESIMIAEHRAHRFDVTVHRVPAPERPRSRRAFFAIEWDAQTSIYAEVTAGSRAQFERYEADAMGMLSSLRPIPIDPLAPEIRAFLRARVRGHGAEGWLTKRAVDLYEEFGLYEAGGEGDIRWYFVEDLHRRADGTVEFDAAVLRRERIVMGPGTNARGEFRRAVVFDVESIQDPGTS